MHRLSPSHTRRAFSLVELLVVIAIIALLIGLAVPALFEARQAARRVQSLANIRSNAQFAMAYTNDNKECYPNPFVPSPSSISTSSTPVRSAQDWVWVPGREGSWGWTYGDSGLRGAGGTSSGTEGFGYHWLAHLLYADQDSLSRVRSIAAPGDKALLTWLKTNNNQSAQSDLTRVFPTSYWYAPTFWQSPDRFASTTPSVASAQNGYSIRRNRVSDVASPGAKVMLFESKDYHAPTQPMWNDVAARPHVAMADGAASRVNMSKVYLDTARTPDRTGEGEESKLDLPSGLWQPGNDEMSGRFLYGAEQGFTWEYGKPAFFWRTRNGIYGRDLR